VRVGPVAEALQDARIQAARCCHVIKIQCNAADKRSRAETNAPAAAHDQREHDKEA
jgi:hypothetical protein